MQWFNSTVVYLKIGFREVEIEGGIKTIVTLFKTVCRFTRGKRSTDICCDKFNWNQNDVDTVFLKKKRIMNKVAESLDSFDKGNKVSRKSAADSVIGLFQLIGPSRLQFFDVWIHVPVRNWCLPLCRSRSVCSLMCYGAMLSTSRSSSFTHFRWRTSVLIRLDPTESVCCLTYYRQTLRLLLLRNHFPLPSICLGFFAPLVHVSRFFLFPYVSSTSSGFRKSFTSSSQLFAWCWGLGSLLRLSLPIVRLVTLKFSLPIHISFFCAFLGVFHEGNVAVLVVICVWIAILCSFFIWASAVRFFVFFVLAGLSFVQFSFGRWDEAFCIGLIISFFRVPWIVSKWQGYNSASTWSSCWVSGVCVVGGTVLISTLFHICRMMSRPFWLDFGSVLFPVAEMHLLVQDIARSHTKIIYPLWCCCSPPLFFCLCFGCLEFSFCLGGFSIRHSRYSAWSRTSFFCSCTSEVENKSTSSAKRRFCEAVWFIVAQSFTHAFCFCQRSTSSFNAIWSIVLRSKVHKVSPLLRSPLHLKPFLFRVLPLQEIDVMCLDTAFFKRFQQRLMTYGIKYFHDVHCRGMLLDGPAFGKND